MVQSKNAVAGCDGVSVAALSPGVSLMPPGLQTQSPETIQLSVHVSQRLYSSAVRGWESAT